VPDRADGALLDAKKIPAGTTHVLVFLPPSLYGNVKDRLTRPGWWELLTVDMFRAGGSPQDGWDWDGSRHTAVKVLAERAASVLGRPVRLSRGRWSVSRGGLLSMSHSEPLFWVRPAED